jgi:hypothetical protein
VGFDWWVGCHADRECWPLDYEGVLDGGDWVGGGLRFSFWVSNVLTFRGRGLLKI